MDSVRNQRQTVGVIAAGGFDKHKRQREEHHPTKLFGAFGVGDGFVMPVPMPVLMTVFVVMVLVIVIVIFFGLADGSSPYPQRNAPILRKIRALSPKL